MNGDDKDVVRGKDKKTEEKKPNGARNLLVLGLASIAIASLTTGVSLAIYHNSGDIYLDRSRPGFLPDEEEIEEESENVEEEYDFSKSGVLTTEVLEEYLKNLKIEGEAVQAYEKPFDAEVLSDEHLGIVETVSNSVEGDTLSEGAE